MAADKGARACQLASHPLQRCAVVVNDLFCSQGLPDRINGNQKLLQSNAKSYCSASVQMGPARVNSWAAERSAAQADGNIQCTSLAGCHASPVARVQEAIDLPVVVLLQLVSHPRPD